VKSKNESEAAPSAVGSLPERIEPSDLLRLNEGLAYLFHELDRATELHRSDPNAGREGVIHSVETAVKFLSLFAPVISSVLHAPLGVLLDALMSLDDGRVLPVLKPAKKTGRSRASALRMSLIGGAAFTVKRLTETGMQAPAARKAVADTLRAVGVKPARGGVITAQTVRGWCAEVSADVGRRSEAAKTYDLLMAEPMGYTTTNELPASQVRKVLVDRLAATAKIVRAQEGA
jgi:hypothetical protein